MVSLFLWGHGIVSSQFFTISNRIKRRCFKLNFTSNGDKTAKKSELYGPQWRLCMQVRRSVHNFSIWRGTKNKLKMKKWSSQWTQFMQLRKEAWKKFRTSTGFEPVTSRLPVRCSTNWAMKPLTLGTSQLWVRMFPWKKWVLMTYEINHI